MLLARWSREVSMRDAYITELEDTIAETESGTRRTTPPGPG